MKLPDQLHFPVSTFVMVNFGVHTVKHRRRNVRVLGHVCSHCDLPLLVSDNYPRLVLAFTEDREATRYDCTVDVFHESIFGVPRFMTVWKRDVVGVGPVRIVVSHFHGKGLGNGS